MPAQTLSPRRPTLAGMSNVHVVVLRLPNSFRPLPLPLSLALLGNVSRLRSPSSISPTTHPHPHPHPQIDPPVLRLPFSSPTAFGVISNPRQSSADPPPRRHPRGLFTVTLTPEPRISITAWRVRYSFLQHF
jgi:hypothetical protein